MFAFKRDVNIKTRLTYVPTLQCAVLAKTTFFSFSASLPDVGRCLGRLRPKRWGQRWPQTLDLRLRNPQTSTTPCRRNNFEAVLRLENEDARVRTYLDVNRQLALPRTVPQSSTSKRSTCPCWRPRMSFSGCPTNTSLSIRLPLRKASSNLVSQTCRRRDAYVDGLKRWCRAHGRQCQDFQIVETDGNPSSLAMFLCLELPPRSES